jgi:hypothetical protein
LAGIFLPLAFLAGFVMVLIAVGSIAGFPLFYPAVAVEGTDHFDAISRGYSYIYSRPWHYAWYQIVTGAYGYVCIAVVAIFAVLMCHWGLKVGGAGFQLCGLQHEGEFQRISDASWDTFLAKEEALNTMSSRGWDPVSIVSDPSLYGRLQAISNEIVDVNRSAGDVSGGHVIAGFMVTVWIGLALGLVLGYGVSYFFSQQTMIYYLLRKKVDGIDMTEVYEEPDPDDDGGAGIAEPKAGEKPEEKDKAEDTDKDEEKDKDEDEDEGSSSDKARKSTKAKKVTKRKKS